MIEGIQYFPERVDRLVIFPEANDDQVFLRTDVHILAKITRGDEIVVPIGADRPPPVILVVTSILLVLRPIWPFALVGWVRRG